MRKTEFLQELREVLEGEVPPAVIQSNITYYDNYITQESAKGKTEEAVIDEIGSPRLIARTIIDSSAAADDPLFGGTYSKETNDYEEETGRQASGVRYINLNKWYWKLLIFVVVLFVLFLFMTILGGIFSLIFHFAGPILLVWLIYLFIKGIGK